MTNEAKIHADIEALRAQVHETQDLYREACTILFFRYGITPTANKLYQYVRKGSMSAPAEALAKFWEDLREKSRVRIEHPDLPDSLKSAAGELVATLWSQAQAAAQEGLESFRSEAQAAVLEAQTAKALAESQTAASLLERDQARLESKVASDRALQLERDLAAESAGKMALASQIEAAGRQQKVLEAALAEARRDFTSELEKHRQAQKQSEDRYEAAEKRSLLEIDRERTTANKLQRDLAETRQNHQSTEERHRKQIAELQAELGGALQKSGVLDGMLQEIRTRCKQQSDELRFLRTTVSEAESRKGLLEQELTACRDLVVRLEGELQQRPNASAPNTRKRSRKENV